MTPYRALIVAAEKMILSLESVFGYADPKIRTSMNALQAAISSAKAAEEGVDEPPMVHEYLLYDARKGYERLEAAIRATGWNPPGIWPECQNVPVECIVNIHQNGVIAQTVVTTGIYEDETDGPDFHPNLPAPDMWGGIEVVLWREAVKCGL